jgi:hypothetical protein
MGFVKHDEGKAPLFELSTYKEGTLEGEARVLAYGAAKYGRDNWHQAEREEAIERYAAAAMRHLLAILRGQWHDEETGQTHAAHLRCCAGFLDYFTECQAAVEYIKVVESLDWETAPLETGKFITVDDTGTMIHPPLEGRVAGQANADLYNEYYQYNGDETITHCYECLEPIKRNQLYMSEDGADFCCTTCQNEWNDG